MEAIVIEGSIPAVSFADHINPAPQQCTSSKDLFHRWWCWHFCQCSRLDNLLLGICAKRPNPQQPQLRKNHPSRHSSSRPARPFAASRRASPSGQGAASLGPGQHDCDKWAVLLPFLTLSEIARRLVLFVGVPGDFVCDLQLYCNHDE